MIREKLVEVFNRLHVICRHSDRREEEPGKFEDDLASLQSRLKPFVLRAEAHDQPEIWNPLG